MKQWTAFLTIPLIRLAASKIIRLIEESSVLADLTIRRSINHYVCLKNALMPLPRGGKNLRLDRHGLSEINELFDPRFEQTYSSASFEDELREEYAQERYRSSFREPLRSREVFKVTGNEASDIDASDLLSEGIYLASYRNGDVYYLDGLLEAAQSLKGNKDIEEDFDVYDVLDLRNAEGYKCIEGTVRNGKIRLPPATKR